MIRMQGVVKTYPGRGGQAPQRVLKGVDLRVRPGEYVAFVGASGSGKSTLMHILGCLDTPIGGRYLLDGEDVSRLDAKALCRVRREKIGFVFQGYQLLSKLTAADNVAFPLMLRGVPEAERARRAAEALARVGLAGRGQSRPCELSGGQQQRVAVARALCYSPRLLLCDEPTGALDYQTSKEILELMENVNRDYGCTVVIVTHNDAIRHMAHRVLRLRDGKLAEDTANVERMAARDLTW